MEVSFSKFFTSISILLRTISIQKIEVEIYHIGIRIMDEIVKPLRDIQMDDTEYTCLKAIVFFDPSNKNVV